MPWNAPRAANGRIPPERRAIAKRIKQHRLTRGWSQAQLGQRLGVTAVTISLWESGRTAIRRQRLGALSLIFGVPLADLTGDLAERRQRVRKFWDQMIRHFKECPNGRAHAAAMANAAKETQRPEYDPELGRRMAADIQELARKLLPIIVVLCV